MNSPVVSTQAREPEEHARHDEEKIQWDEGLMLLNWAGALEGAGQQGFNELQAVPPDHRLGAGLGSLSDDALASERIDRCKPERLLVAVKSWEPPMADLRDFLHGLQNPGFCKLCLVPLPGRAVAERNMQEWRNFARQLPFDLVDAQELLRL